MRKIALYCCVVYGMRASVLFAIALLAPVSGESLSTARATVLAGSAWTGDGGAALAALLTQPQGVAVDTRGNVYIADAADQRVRVVDPDGMIETIAGTGRAGFSGDGAAANQAQINQPYGVAVDGAGNVYFADLGNARVRKIGADGVIHTIAGGGSLDPAAAEGGSALLVKLNAPRNVAVAADGSVYISDFGANQIYRVDAAGVFNIVAGTGAPGATGDGGPARVAELAAPAGLAVSREGALFVADSGNGKIRRIGAGIIETVLSGFPGPSGIAVDAFGRLYTCAPFAGPGTLPSPAGPVQVFGGNDVALAVNGDVVFAYERQVLRSGAGIVTPVAGSGQAHYYGDDGPATDARLAGPAALAVDVTGAVFIADTANNRVRLVNAAGVITTYAGDGSTSVLAQPLGVALDASGVLYIADTGNGRLLAVAPGGGTPQTVADGLLSPACVRVANGVVYVCDTGNDRIVTLAPGGTLKTVAAVARPRGLAVAQDGTLFTSTGTQIVRVDTAGRVSTVADGLSGAAGLWLLSSGDVLAAEAGRDRVIRVAPDGHTTVVLDGLRGPQDVSADAAGTIYVADTGNDRVMRLNALAVEDTSPGLSIVNAASGATGAVSRGEIVTLFGTGFGTNPAVTFAGEAATVFFANDTQINALVPADAGSTGPVAVAVSAGAHTFQTTATLAPVAPGIFTMAGGTGQAAALNEDGTVNSSSNAAARGSIIVLYATGTGADTAGLTVTIGGYAAAVLYAGPAPGFPGLDQINARIPAAFVPPGALPVVLTTTGVQSLSGVYISAR